MHVVRVRREEVAQSPVAWCPLVVLCGRGVRAPLPVMPFAGNQVLVCQASGGLACRDLCS